MPDLWSTSMSSRTADRSRGVNSSRGSVTGFVVCTVAMLVACAGLAFDGGRVIAAYVHAVDVAEGASRAGSQVVVGVRAGNPRLSTSSARRQAQAFLASAGMSGTVHVDAAHVEVVVSETVRMKILGFFGVASKVVRVTRTAAPFAG